MLNLSLPKFKIQNIAFKLKPAAEREIKKGHPWVYQESITKQSKEGHPGDLAIIFEKKTNRFLACGLYDPNSPIRIKVLQFHEKQSIDAAWFEQKISDAYDLRIPLFDSDTNSYRFIFGENDGLPGFIADKYSTVLVIKLYSAIWLPYLEPICHSLIKYSKAKTVVLRLSRILQREKSLHQLNDGQILFGKLENEEVLFKEFGISFLANVIKGHKTGYFLDHRQNRRKVGLLSKDKSVLDVFAYAGGFSVHALVGEAKSVSSLDISKQALEVAKKNVSLNKSKGEHIVLAGDAFQLMRELAQENNSFDIVVVDPPSFAKRKPEVEKAINQYRRLASLGVNLTAKNGLLVLASCSSRITSDEFFNTIEGSIEKSGRTFKCVEKTFHDIDHPIRIKEAAYLKCGYYKMDI